MPNTKTVVVISEEEYLAHTESFDGLCLSCENWSCGGVEPDAEGYICEACQEPMVMGAEQALICGHIEFGEDELEGM